MPGLWSHRDGIQCSTLSNEPQPQPWLLTNSSIASPGPSLYHLPLKPLYWHSCLLWGRLFAHLPRAGPPGHSCLLWGRHSHMVWLHVVLFQTLQHRGFKA